MHGRRRIGESGNVMADGFIQQLRRMPSECGRGAAGLPRQEASVCAHHRAHEHQHYSCASGSTPHTEEQLLSVSEIDYAHASIEHRPSGGRPSDLLIHKLVERTVE